MTTSPTPLYSRHAAALLARGLHADPESVCVHTGAGTYPEPCATPECRHGVILSAHVSPMCVEERACADCNGTGRTGRMLCVGCDAPLGSE
jgi:hypothetical protein